MAETDTSILFGATTLKSSGPQMTDWKIEAKANGTDRGNPEAVVASIPSMLMDGDRAQITKFGNLMIPIAVTITGATLDVVAQGEAALMVEVNAGRNTVTWKPPGVETLSVFDVIYSTLDFQFDEVAETQSKRRFLLTLICAPFARRSTLTTVVATPVPTGSPTVTPIDACTSTTGWSAASATLSTAGGAIVIDDIPAAGSGSEAVVTRTGLAVTVAAGEYVRIELEADLAVRITGFDAPGGATVRATDVISVSALTTRRYYYLQVASPFTGVSIGLTYDAGGVGQAKIHDVSKVDRLPSSGPNQRSFTALVGGTARTTADLVVEADDGLGAEVIVFTAPVAQAIDPPLRKWLTTAGTTDAAAVSGKSNVLASDEGIHAEIPVSLLPPGMHLVGVRMKLSAGGPTNVDVAWSAALLDSPWVDSSASVVGGTTTIPLTTTYTCFALGVVELPTVAVDLTSGALASLGILTLSAPTCNLDDIYLFNLDTGTLTWLNGLTVSGDTPSKVEIRSATIDRDYPAWLVGTAGTDTDNVDASANAVSPGVHEFPSGLMSIFVMTPGVTEQTVSLELYERFQHHVTPQAS